MMVRLRIAMLAVALALSAAFIAVGPVWSGEGRPVAAPTRTATTASSSATPSPTATRPTTAPSSSAPADPCDSSWCWRRVTGYEVGGLYERDGEWGTEFILEHGARVCARPISTPPGLREILPGDEPVWRGYVPGNTAADDTFVFQSEVRDGGRCDGPSR